MTKSDAKRCIVVTLEALRDIAGDAAKIWIRFQCEFPTIIADSFNVSEHCENFFSQSRLGRGDFFKT